MDRIAAEKYVTIMISPASSSLNLNLVCSNPFAPSKKGMYIPKFIVQIKVNIQNEYFSSFKSFSLIVYLWASPSAYEWVELVDDLERISYTSSEFYNYCCSDYYSALFITLMNLTAKIANKEQIVQNITDMKNAPPSRLSKSS